MILTSVAFRPHSRAPILISDSSPGSRPGLYAAARYAGYYPLSPRSGRPAYRHGREPMHSHKQRIRARVAGGQHIGTGVNPFTATNDVPEPANAGDRMLPSTKPAVKIHYRPLSRAPTNQPASPRAHARGFMLIARYAGYYPLSPRMRVTA